jgi:hypothetical protein
MKYIIKAIKIIFAVFGIATAGMLVFAFLVFKRIFHATPCLHIHFSFVFYFSFSAAMLSH